MPEKPPKNPLENDPKANQEAEKAAAHLRQIVEKMNESDIETEKKQEEILKAAKKISKETETERLERIIKERKFFPPAEIPVDKREMFDEEICKNCGGDGLDGACEACGGKGKILVLKEKKSEDEEMLGI